MTDSLPPGGAVPDADELAARCDGVLPLLGEARRDVLGAWLTRTHPGHPWLAGLARR